MDGWLAASRGVKCVEKHKCGGSHAVTLCEMCREVLMAEPLSSASASGDGRR